MTVELDGTRVRAYRTGDLAHLREDRSVEVLGRIDEQLNLRGFRVEPQEVEDRLVAHPHVRAAVALAKETDDGDVLLVAYVTTSGPLDTAELREFAAGSLPRHMVPVVVVVLDELPLGTSGKVDRQRLAAMPLPVPSAASYEAADASDDPVRRIAGVMAGVLGLDPASVGGTTTSSTSGAPRSRACGCSWASRTASASTSRCPRSRARRRRASSPPRWRPRARRPGRSPTRRATSGSG